MSKNSNHTNSYENKSFQINETKAAIDKIDDEKSTISNEIQVLNICKINDENTNNNPDEFKDIKSAPNQIKIKSNDETSNTDADDNDDLDDDDEENLFGKCIIKTRSFIINIIKKPIFKWIFVGLIGILYPIYFGFAMKLNNPFYFPSNVTYTQILTDYVFTNNRGLALFCLTVITVLLLLWDYLTKKFRNQIEFTFEFVKRILITKAVERHMPKIELITSWIIVLGVVAATFTYLLVSMKDYSNLTSLSGLLAFVLIAAFCSEKPSKIRLRPLIAGLMVQLIFGILTMRFEFGYQLFHFFGTQVERFLDFTDYGSQLVFGDNFRDHYFAFKAMPALIFFSAVVHLLYAIGFIQYIILKISFVVNKLMSTSPTESTYTVSTVFVGMSEAALIIQPFLEDMTESELFTIMAAGFATVAGSTLAAYISFGISASQLLVASIMSAPAALTIAKVFYPETKKTKADWNKIRSLPKGESLNIFEIISNGATSIIKCVSSIVGCVIAFVSIFRFVDTIVGWLLSMLNVENAGFTTIFQYVFWPIVVLMGTAIEDCSSVAKLVGLKIFINEFIAYQELGKAVRFKESFNQTMIQLYKNGTYSVPSNIIMVWNDKSVAIATYALCGFSNFGSVGIQVGFLSTLAPKKKKLFAKVGFMALFASNIACFMTSCMAGLLFENEKR